MYIYIYRNKECRWISLCKVHCILPDDSWCLLTHCELSSHHNFRCKNNRFNAKSKLLKRVQVAVWEPYICNFSCLLRQWLTLAMLKGSDLMVEASWRDAAMTHSCILVSYAWQVDNKKQAASFHHVDTQNDWKTHQLMDPNVGLHQSSTTHGLMVHITHKHG